MISGKAARLAVLLLAVAAAPALANQGKAGLWNVTSATDVGMTAKTRAAMKVAGEPIAAAQPTTVQMCMSQAEVESDQPPQLASAATGCAMKVISRSAGALNARMVCKGAMKGTGNIQVAYRGAQHYSGSYRFKGTTHGLPTNVVTRFTGDWLKPDCGKIKPPRPRVP